MDVVPIIVQAGTTAGSPFAVNHLVKITNPPPAAQLSSIPAQGLTDGAVQYVAIPNSAGVVCAVAGATEGFRAVGGIITEATGAVDSVQIGRAAVGATVDSITIGRGAVGSTVARGVVIGAASNGGGGASVVLGYNSGSGAANPVGGVFIGDTAQASGNAGGANVVVIGDGAIIALGGAGGGGGVGIGFGVTIAHPSSVTIGYGAQSTFASALGQNTVTIGNLAISNKAGTTIVGGASTSTQTASIVIGSGASVSATSGVASIVIGQTSSSSNAGAIVVGTNSTLTSLASAAIGHGCRDMGANVIQFGGPTAAYNVIVLGQGDTVASPAAKGFRFTDASGADNAAGSFTLQAPRSSGNALPASLIFTVGQQVAGSSSTLQTAGAALTLSHTTAGGHLGTFSNALAVTGGFGCNTKAPQAPYASGGLLAGVVAALVANGILSN